MLTYKAIAVALDFSKSSVTAFERAAIIAEQHGATLHLVSVIDTESFGAVSAYDVKYAEQLKVERLQQVEQLKKQAITLGVGQVEGHVEVGSPKVILTELAVDLIVIGATGLNRLEKMVLGSVSEKVVRHASCDVLIVRNLSVN